MMVASVVNTSFNFPYRCRSSAFFSPCQWRHPAQQGRRWPAAATLTRGAPRARGCVHVPLRSYLQSALHMLVVAVCRGTVGRTSGRGGDSGPPVPVSWPDGGALSSRAPAAALSAHGRRERREKEGEGKDTHGSTRRHTRSGWSRPRRSLTPRCGVMHWARCAQTSSLLSRRPHETIFEMRPSARSALLLLCAALLCVLPLSSAFTPVSRRQSNIDAAAARGEPLVLPDRDCLNDDGSTVWMCISTVLVLGMCPALALFEAGMLRSKSTVSIVTQVISGVVTLSVMWILIGHTQNSTRKHTAAERARARWSAVSSPLLLCRCCVVTRVVVRFHSDLRSESGWLHRQPGSRAVHRRELHRLQHTCAADPRGAVRHVPDDVSTQTTTTKAEQ